ncbi:right-handed parallel beta-helix repeat-containing protein [Candidatus Woesearchaeota archaeon]|nr:right-handed parallel beta-helix repeat-containing protein [Candidatus Woesearchaeota archaeon]
MVVIENTTLCPGTYKLSGGIEIDAHGVVLDCDDTVLVGKRIGYGIVSSYDDDILIKNCIVENYSNGIAVTSDTSLGLLADRPIIRNTISRNNAAQGYIFRARNGSFASNKGLNNGADGITLKYLNNNTLNDNEFKNNVGYGINLFDSDGNKIINNNISNNSRGILVESGSLFNTLLRNSFWNNTRGAHLGQGSYGNTFSDNFLQGNSVGIYVDNGTNIISQNSITSSTTFGLFNNAKAQVTAINNFWGTNSGEYIEQAIYDDEESLGAKGKVNFDPWLRKDIGSCDNGIKDSLESDVDCGGVCGPCPDGKKCASNTGCKGKFCSNGVCATVSCNDGFQNGFEEGIDCGWICKKGCPICNGLTINGRSRDKIDVVFVGSGFPNISSWFQTAADFVDYNGSLGGLMSVSPFKENKGKFNFWAVNSLPAFTLEKYEQQARKLGKSACPQWDQLVFLSFEPRFWPHAYIKPYSGIGKKEAFIVAGCEYLGMCEFPLDIARPQDGQDPGNCRGDGGIFFDCANAGDNKFEVVRTLVHEFGHSFGGLMDEYKNAGANPKNPGKVPNCDISGCPKWASLAGITCSSECFYSNWYRPYKNSLMRNSYRPDAEFGEVHRIELEKDINASLKNFFGIFEESSPEYNLSFVAEIIFEEGNLSVRNVSLASGRAENIDDENSSYRAVVFSSLNDTLYSLNFSLALEPVFSPPRSFFDQNDSQVIVPNESDFASVNFTEDAITLPYFIDAERIDILGGNGSAVLSINVSEFQDLDKDFLPRLADNCPEVYNPGQPDSDNNGLGDDCQMFISKGWSLVSFPSWFNPATVRRIGSRLSMDPIKPVLTFKDGHWLNLSPDSEVNTSMALWAYGIRDMNSTIAGIPFNTSQGIELQRGWNLIGYPSGKSIGINETMVSAPITRVYSFRWGDWFSYVKGRDASMNRLQNFTAGWGYWVYSLDDTNLSMS